MKKLLDQKVIKELIDIVGKENVLQSKVTLAAYSYDSSPYKGNPGAVVFPTTTEMVAQVIKIANNYNIPVLPRGAGTCLSGGAVPQDNSIVIALSKMNQVLEVNPIGRYAVVQAGTPNKRVQQAAQPFGMMFAPDPASQSVATIGGNVASNSGGMRGVKYGSTKDHVLGLEVVLPSGDIVTTGGINSELIPEIDLTYLLCGSEGTFGIVTKAWLALSPINNHVITLTATFAKLEDAGACVAEIIAAGVVPTTMEILDNTVIVAIEEYMNLGLDKGAAAWLLIEVDGFAAEVQTQAEKIIAAFKNNKSSEYKIAKNEAERQDLWKARRSVNGALGKIRPANMVHDIAVPRDRLAFMLKRVAEISEKYGIIIGQVAHAGDGNSHPTLLFDDRNHREFELVEEAGDEIIKEAIAQGGVISGEHGIGIEKLRYMPMAFTQDSLQYMQLVKDAFDPANLLNPGKLLPPELKGEGGSNHG